MFQGSGKRLAVEIREDALATFLNLAIQPLLLPRLALARQSLGQEDLEQRLVRNVTPIRQYFEILNHGDRRRSDMVLRDGFRRTRFLRFPACQSTYSVESAVAQNFLSSSSFLNSGSFFFISLIGRRFVPVHVSAEITRMSFR